MIKLKPFRLFPFGLTVLLLLGLALATGALADGLPTGQRFLGQTTLEPAYNDANGSIVFLLTPNHAPDPVKANPRAWAPLYLVVYPALPTGVSALNCQDVPVENCPNHGAGIAAAAASIEPGVYGGGVKGHDHLVAAPASGGDFNIAWEPVLVLFTSPPPPNEHITTVDQLSAAVSSGAVIEIPLPSLTFNCAVVSAAVYNRGTPVGG